MVLALGTGKTEVAMNIEPLLRVPATPQIQNLFADFTPTEQGFGTIRHDIGSTIMLRNLGFDVQSPVQLYYDFPHPIGQAPFDIQKITVEKLVENKRFYVLSGMGTGKTACIVWAYHYLRRLGLGKKMLVVCPLSTMKFTWAAEFFKLCNDLRVVIVYGSKAKRLQLLAQDADVYIINHDGPMVVSEALMALAASGELTHLALDELAVYRNATDRSKWMQKFAQSIEFVWGLTGAPTPHLPTDVFGQAKVITPQRVDKHFGTFKRRCMLQVAPFTWVPRKEANEIAFDALQPSVRFQLEDVTELPEFVSTRPDVDLGPKQKLVYEAIRKDAFAMVGANQITAVNAAAALNKLLQISLGWVYDNDGNVVQLDNDARLAKLGEILDACEGKVIVFSAFKHAQAGIETYIKSRDYSTVLVNGDTSAGKRAEIFRQFQFEEHPRVLNAHPQCMAHGVTLTAARTTLWFGPILSNEIYSQANMRIRRIGQKFKQAFVHIQATAAEKKAYNLLIAQESMQSQLLDMFRGD